MLDPSPRMAMTRGIGFAAYRFNAGPYAVSVSIIS
jgi:hypothetical protein